MKPRVLITPTYRRVPAHGPGPGRGCPRVPVVSRPPGGHQSDRSPPGVAQPSPLNGVDPQSWGAVPSSCRSLRVALAWSRQSNFSPSCRNSRRRSPTATSIFVSDPSIRAARSSRRARIRHRSEQNPFRRRPLIAPPHQRQDAAEEADVRASKRRSASGWMSGMPYSVRTLSHAYRACWTADAETALGRGASERRGPHVRGVGHGKNLDIGVHGTHPRSADANVPVVVHDTPMHAVEQPRATQEPARRARL